MYGQYQYGTFSYSDAPLTPDDIKPFIPDLMKYLPPYYHKIYEMKEIQKTSANELGFLKYFADDIFKQVFLDTATWGLELWEKDLGIITDFSKSDQFRREIIKARLRGRGTVTKKLIKKIAESFTNAEVEVIEQPATFSFVIKFIGVKGIPPNMAGLIEEIENIKPAHLLYSFEYTYTWWDKLKELTWNEASEKTWDELKVY